MCSIYFFPVAIRVLSSQWIRYNAIADKLLFYKEKMYNKRNEGDAYFVSKIGFMEIFSTNIQR